MYINKNPQHEKYERFYKYIKANFWLNTMAHPNTSVRPTNRIKDIYTEHTSTRNALPCVAFSPEVTLEP